MTITSSRTTTSWTAKASGSPRWAILAAHTIAWCTIPSALWRIGIIVGIPHVYDQGWISRSHLDTPFGAVRMIMLCLISEGLALLAFGMVQRWGEVAPPWLGPLAGRRIPKRLPVILAGAGCIGLCLVWTIGVPMAWIAKTPFDPGMNWGTASMIQLATYLPMIIWGPLLAALTVQYARRVDGSSTTNNR